MNRHRYARIFENKYLLTTTGMIQRKALRIRFGG